MIKSHLCLLTNQYCTLETCGIKCNREIPANEPKEICVKSISDNCKNYTVKNGVKICNIYSCEVKDITNNCEE